MLWASTFRKAVVVDDIKSNRVMLARVLRKLGIPHVEADDGHSALLLPHLHTYDVWFVEHAGATGQTLRVSPSEELALST